MVTRQIGFKDYGKIMPGHGGLMDRFDSVLFVLPTFYVFIAFFGIHMYL
jgi:phosphatidate cytidylyltransferase